MPTLQKRRMFHLAIFMFKVMKGLIVSLYLSHLFQPIDLRHAVVTRAFTRNDLVIPRTRTVFGNRAISVVGPVTWNSLLHDVKGANSAETFKSRYLRLV